MTRLVAHNPFDMYAFLTDSSLADFFQYGQVITATSTRLVVHYSYGGVTQELVLTGTFGNYVDGYPTTGTVTGGSFGYDGVTLFSLSGVSISVPDFRDYVAADDIIGLFAQMLQAADQMIGSSGVDVLFGVSGNDLMDGRGGDDHLIGGTGNDSYYVNSAADQVYELPGEGSDTVYSTAATFALPNHDAGYVENLTYIGAGSFTGTGNWLNNIIRGGSGNDRLDGGLGADSMYGGLGNDTYTVDNRSDTAVETSATGGSDTVLSSVTFRLGANVEKLTLLGTAAINATGNGLANTLLGNSAANVLNGAAGADSMRGGAGNDTYFVDNAGDAVAEASLGGTDIVKSSVSFTLGLHVEKLTLIGTAAINGSGNGLANTIVGNGAANVLSGAAGQDTLRGLAGADTLAGGTANDVLTGGAGADAFLFDTALNASSNVDRITDFSVTDDTIHLDQTIFTALGLGTLSSSAFTVGTSAQDGDDRIIYDSATGRIYYDADGNGAGAAVLFAQVSAGLAITNADFLIVS